MSKGPVHKLDKIRIILYPSFCALFLLFLPFLVGDTFLQEVISVGYYMIPVISVSQAMQDQSTLERTSEEQAKYIESLYGFVQNATKIGIVTLSILVVCYLIIHNLTFELILYVMRPVCATCWYGVYIGRLYYDHALVKYGKKDQHASEKDLSKYFRFLIPRMNHSSPHDHSASSPTPTLHAPSTNTPVPSFFMVPTMVLIALLLILPLSYLGFFLYNNFMPSYVVLPFLPVIGFYLLYQGYQSMQAKIYHVQEVPLTLRMLPVSIIIATLVLGVGMLLWMIFTKSCDLMPYSWPHYMLTFCLSMLSIAHIYVRRNRGKRRD